MRFQLSRAALGILSAARIFRDSSQVSDERLLTGFQHMRSYETFGQTGRVEIGIFLGIIGSASFGNLLLGYRRQMGAQRVGIQSLVIGLCSRRIVGAFGTHYLGSIELIDSAASA